MTRKFETLRELREHFGYRPGTVAHHSGIGPERLSELEAAAAPTVLEAEQLAELFGLDADALCDRPIVQDDAMAVLTSLDEYRQVSEAVRVRTVRAANTTRDLRALLDSLGQEDPRTPLDRLAREIRKGLDRSFEQLAAHRQGAQLAKRVRETLDLGQEPIRSVSGLVTEAFASVAVLYSELGDDGPAGLSFRDPLRGPAIVLNLQGKNRNVFARRFSLAHELCHLLFDFVGRPMAMISGYFTESQFDVERRANAFAVRLLCPEPVLRRLESQHGDAVRVASELMSQYGLPYGAVRLYIRNETQLEPLPASPSASITLQRPDHAWEAGEEPLGLREFPEQSTPNERRTLVARAAAQAYSRDLISRDRFAEVLRLTPVHELEAVLDYFELDPPAGDLAA